MTDEEQNHWEFLLRWTESYGKGSGSAKAILAADAELKRLREAVDVAERWRKRKGHNDDHDCDLCNAIRRSKEG